jgi:hypothetical protein
MAPAGEAKRLGRLKRLRRLETPSLEFINPITDTRGS